MGTSFDFFEWPWIYLQLNSNRHYGRDIFITVGFETIDNEILSINILILDLLIVGCSFLKLNKIMKNDLWTFFSVTNNKEWTIKYSKFRVFSFGYVAQSYLDLHWTHFLGPSRVNILYIICKTPHICNLRTHICFKVWSSNASRFD
jgi:hypothetical protein